MDRKTVVFLGVVVLNVVWLGWLTAKVNSTAGDTITCRHLRIVDDEGHERMRLRTVEDHAYLDFVRANGHEVLQLYSMCDGKITGLETLPVVEGGCISAGTRLETSSLNSSLQMIGYYGEGMIIEPGGAEKKPMGTWSTRPQK